MGGLVNFRVRSAALPTSRIPIPKAVKTWADVMALADAGTVPVFTHRGGGGHLAKDNALSSLDFAVSQGMGETMFFDGGDIRMTSDGVLVVSHDATTGKYMDRDVTVSSTTYADFKTLRMRDFPLHLGTISTEAPPSAEEWLLKCRDLGYFTAPEIKVGGSAPQKLADLIVSLGMVDRCTVQSFVASELEPAKTAGIAVSLLQSPSYNIGSAAIKTAVNGGPPDSVLYQRGSLPGSDDLWIKDLASVGVRFQVGTTAGRRYALAAENSRLQALGARMTFAPSDNPFYLAGRNPVLTSDRFATQHWEHGIAASLQSEYPNIKEGRLKFERVADAQYSLLGMFAGEKLWTQMEADVTWDALDTSSTKWTAFFFGMSDDRNMHNGTEDIPGTTSVLFRQNGDMVILYNTNSTTNLGTVVARLSGPEGTSSADKTLVPATLGKIVRMRIENRVDATGAFTGQCRVTRLDTGQWTETAVGACPINGPFTHIGKNGTGGMLVSFSNFVLTNSA